MRCFTLDQRRNIKLTSSEIATLWTTYMSDSASICILSHFFETVEDQIIKDEISFAINVSKSHINNISKIFNQENYHVPIGFDKNNDVNNHAPRIFSDSFYLYFLRNMAAGGLANYAMALNLSTRKDIIDVFSECVKQSVDMKKRITDVMLHKGLYIKPPYLDYIEKPSFVDNESFLRGWFGQRRTLTSQEASHLYLNLYNNALGKAIVMGFGQVAKTEEIRNFFKKGNEIATKFIDILSTPLTESDLPVPMTWDTEVMNTTTPPYSEKLMMFLVGAISGIAIADYGASLSLSLRHDLAQKYLKLITEAGSYAEDGASIMIKNGWFERPPQAIDRRAISNSN